MVFPTLQGSTNPLQSSKTMPRYAYDKHTFAHEVAVNSGHYHLALCHYWHQQSHYYLHFSSTLDVRWSFIITQQILPSLIFIETTKKWAELWYRSFSTNGDCFFWSITNTIDLLFGRCWKHKRDVMQISDTKKEKKNWLSSCWWYLFIFLSWQCKHEHA